MQRLKPSMSNRKPSFPVHIISKRKSKSKSCFIDSDRVDIVKIVKTLEKKSENIDC